MGSHPDFFNIFGWGIQRFTTPRVHKSIPGLWRASQMASIVMRGPRIIRGLIAYQDFLVFAEVPGKSAYSKRSKSIQDVPGKTAL